MGKGHYREFGTSLTDYALFEFLSKMSEMVNRNPDNYPRLLKDQYGLLKDAVVGFYTGNEAKANDVAVRIRILVHSTSESQPLLFLVAANYLELSIYHKPASKDAIFVMNQPMRLSGDGAAVFIRDDFTSPSYVMVPLSRWWTEEYLIMGAIRSSKKQIVVDVANKDGGAHIDPKVPLRHAVASAPPLFVGSKDKSFRPNLARIIVAQAGNELLNYIERHFPNVTG